jgi:hypothetical protein
MTLERGPRIFVRNGDQFKFGQVARYGDLRRLFDSMLETSLDEEGFTRDPKQSKTNRLNYVL